MSFWFQVKRCVAALLGLTVALVGLALVLQLAALLLWQYGIALQKPSWPRLPIELLFADHAKLASTALAPYLQYMPQVEWSWLANREDTSATHAVAVWLVNKVHIGVVPALLGVPLLLSGGRLVLRQIGAFDRDRRYRADRLRRVAEYRRQPSSERLEPQFEYRDDRFEQRDHGLEQRNDRRDQERERLEAQADRSSYRREPFIGAEVEAPRRSAYK